MTPYGFTRAWMEAVLPRLDELEQREREHETAKRATGSAQTVQTEGVRALRRWYTPWRKRLTRVLRDHPELRRRLGLPS